MVPEWDGVGFPRVEISCKRHQRRTVDLGILTVICKNQTIEKKKTETTLVTTIINNKTRNMGITTTGTIVMIL